MLSPASGLETKKLFSTLARCAAASIPLALACKGILTFGPTLIPADNLISRALIVLFSIVLSVAAYAATCTMLRVEETTAAWELVKKKLGRRLK